MDGFTILFLGTCACDFSPRLQTDCKDRFDKDVRRSSSILIDGHILVDCGPHTLNSLEIVKKPLCEITDIFLTHLHSDHFDAANIQKIAEAKGEKLRLWVRADACMPQLQLHRWKPTTPISRSTLYLKKPAKRFFTDWTAHGC